MFKKIKAAAARLFSGGGEIDPPVNREERRVRQSVMRRQSKRARGERYTKRHLHNRTAGGKHR